VEIAEGILIVLGCAVLLACLFGLLCVIFGGTKKFSTIPLDSVARSFGHMASQLQDKAEKERLHNIKLQTRLLHIREYLIQVTKRVDKEHPIEGPGKRYTLQEMVTELILDKSKWEVSDE